MKTRCRKYGTRKRMTADVSHPSRQETSKRNHDAGVDETDEFCAKEGQVLHETRSQKQAVKTNPRDEHADTIKDSTGEVESEFPGGSVGVSTRSSTRPSKRLKLSSSPPYKSVDQENKDDQNIASSNPASASVAVNGKKQKAKAKRQWESWGTKGKDAFFEALNEFGKDFDKIQSYIAAKHKRRGDQPALIKNKDQVRHFYYRTLNKISKYIPSDKGTDESDPHKKTLHELKGLICYGELRKKMCGLNEKHGKKLRELISHGTTTIRYNGRNFKIKAPVCRALKRLHPTSSGISEDTETQSPTVPNKLLLELTPHDNATWCAVQKMAKNPRLKTTVLSKKPLGPILHFLNKKWPAVSSKTNKPLKICILVPPEFYSGLVEGTGSSVNKCNQRVGGLTTSETGPNICTNNKVDETKAVSPSSEDGSLSAEKLGVTHEVSVAAYATTQSVMNDDVMETDLIDGMTSSQRTLNCVNLCDLNLGLSLQTDSVPTLSDPLSEGPEPIPGARNGNPTFWTADNCGNVTFSSIYHKLGCPASCKLKLEYKWQKEESSSQNDSNPLKKLVNIASVEFARLNEGKKNDLALAKSSTTTPSSICAYPTSRNTRIAPKATERLPFILPSVTTTAAQQSSASTPVVHEFPPPSRPVPKTKKQQRKPAPIVQRTLLPRPVVPPGAVAVSFIPQPGQEVGTILASGMSTVSTATASTAVSSETGASTSTKTTMSVTPVLSPAASCTDTSPVPSPSQQAMAVSGMLTTQCGEDASTLGNTSMVSTTSVTQQQTSAASLASSVATFTTSTDMIDLAFGETDGMPSSFAIDQFVHSAQQLSANPDSLDSIIGLAFGTALNGKGPNISLAAMNNDSGSDILASLTNVKPACTDFTIDSQPLNAVNSNASLDSSGVQVEELNSGISGGPPITLSTSTFNSIPISTAGALDSPVSTCAQSVFFSSSGPVSTVVISTQDYNGAPQQDLALLPNPTSTSSNLPSLRINSLEPDSQWLNGEAADISIGSFLDKLSTSPKKQSKSSSFEDSTGSSENKFSSHYSLVPSHHLLDAETAMHAVMDENSVDYIKKFQDLANTITGDDNEQTAFLGGSKTLTFSSHNSLASGSRENLGESTENGLDDTLTFKNILSRQNSG